MRTTSQILVSLMLMGALTACGGQETTEPQATGSASPEIEASNLGRISFDKNWGETLSGTLRQGGDLVINYNLDRLGKCRGTHNGNPAWDIVAHVRFSPGGQHQQGSVRTLDAPNGVPRTNSATSAALTVKIPAGATSAAIWFHNYTGAGSSCQAWDSNFGANYTYQISPPASSPRCKDMQRWTKQNSDMPYSAKEHCLEYDVDEQYDASYCELHLDGVGEGYMAHYGIPQGWIEAYIKVPAQTGTLLGVGMWTRTYDPDTKTTGGQFVMGRKLDSDTWQSGFQHVRTSIYSGSYHYQVQAMAFFIDVKRASGKVVRLWQSRGGANYSMADAFNGGTSTKYIPYGNIKYATSGAVIFDGKRACGK